jgi:PAS domain S-box-containing protein
MGEIAGVIGLAVDDFGSPSVSHGSANIDLQPDDTWSGDGLLAVDGQGRLTFVTRSAGELLGRAPRELVGLYVHEAVHAAGGEGLWHPVGGCELEAHVTDGRPHHVGREVFYRPDGSRFPAEYVTTPMYEENRLMGTVLIFKDAARRAPAIEVPQRDEFVEVPDVDEGAWATRM